MKNLGVWVTLGIFTAGQCGTGLWYGSALNQRVANMESDLEAQAIQIKEIDDAENQTAIAIEGIKRTQDATRSDIKSLDLDIKDLDEAVDELNQLLRQLLMQDGSAR